MWFRNYFKALITLSLVWGIQKTYAQTDSIKVTGTLSGLGNNSVVMSFSDAGGVSHTFKAQANNDVFLASLPAQVQPVVGKLDVSIKRSLKYQSNGQSSEMPMPPLEFFIGKKDLNVKGEAMLVQLASVKGDIENDKFAELKEKTFANDKKSIEVMKAWISVAETNQDEAEKLKNEGAKLSKSIAEEQKLFINQNPDALASVLLLIKLKNYYTTDGFVKVWNALSQANKESSIAKPLKNYVQRMESTLSGKPVFAFERLDKDGNKVSPALLKGKVYLLDFWGSWCGPCRASNPHLKTLYQKYNSKGFEIVGIAQELSKNLDECKTSWLGAIKADELPWIQVLNNDGAAQQDLVRMFNITGFPTKILVDDKGAIILRVTSSATDDIDKALLKIYGI